MRAWCGFSQLSRHGGMVVVVVVVVMVVVVVVVVVWMVALVKHSTVSCAPNA